MHRWKTAGFLLQVSVKRSELASLFILNRKFEAVVFWETKFVSLVKCSLKLSSVSSEKFEILQRIKVYQLKFKGDFSKSLFKLVSICQPWPLKQSRS